MKTITPLIASAILLALASTSPAFAQTKGAERLNSLNPPQAAKVAQTPASHAMKCKTETRIATDRAARGGVKSTVYTAHVCPSCKTTEVVKGVGKLATRKLEHTCDTATVCCNPKS
jgi:hypothetical protein